MTITDYQLAVSTTGLILGPTTNYIIKTPGPLGLGQMRASQHVKPFDHGEFLSPEYVGAREWPIDLSVRGDSPALAQANVDALIQAWYMDNTGAASFDTVAYMSAKLPGWSEPRRLYGRPRASAVDVTTIVQSHAEATLSWYAGDPRWYSDSLHTQAFATSVAVSGRGWPRAFNYGWGGTGSSGAVVVTNAGTFNTWPVWTFTGPLTNLTLSNGTQTLTITLTMTAGDVLVVDFNAKTVLLNGASRYFAKGGSWWSLLPGSNSIQFTTSAGSGTASMSWRDAWL